MKMMILHNIKKLTWSKLTLSIWNLLLRQNQNQYSHLKKYKRQNLNESCYQEQNLYKQWMTEKQRLRCTRFKTRNLNRPQNLNMLKLSILHLKNHFKGLFRCKWWFSILIIHLSQNKNLGKHWDLRTQNLLKKKYIYMWNM